MQSKRFIPPHALDNFVPSAQHASMAGEVRIRIPAWPNAVRVESIARDLGTDAESVLCIIDKIDGGCLYHDHDGEFHRVAVMPGHWYAWNETARRYFHRAYAGALIRNQIDLETQSAIAMFQRSNPDPRTPRQRHASGRIAMEGWMES